MLKQTIYYKNGIIMKNIDIENIIKENIDKELIRNNINEMIIEELTKYSINYINESILTEKKKKKSSSPKKKSKKKTKDTEFVKQVTNMLQDDKIDLAAVAKKVYPDMQDDSRRSYASKQARGKRPISHKEATSYYNAVRNALKTK